MITLFADLPGFAHVPAAELFDPRHPAGAPLGLEDFPEGQTIRLVSAHGPRPDIVVSARSGPGR